MKYEEYLESEEWKQLRAKAYERAGNKCELCGREAGAVHHIKYPKHLSNDHLRNLLVVCNECHEKLHGLKPLHNYEQMFIGLMNDLVYFLRAYSEDNKKDRDLLSECEPGSTMYKILEFKIDAAKCMLTRLADIHDKHHPHFQDEGEAS